MLAKTTLTRRLLLSVTEGRIGRLCYHELSFPSNGEPSEVLEYHQANENDDNDRPSVTHVGVDMLYAPLNPADINTIQGTYPRPDDTQTRMSLKFPKMTVLGSEGIGRVRHAGGNFKEGDIVTVGTPGIGTMRSFLWAPNTSLLPVERGEELLQRGAAVSTLPQLGGTALRMLLDFASEGVVIQNAGNSGVGLMVSQLSHSMHREVISIVRRNSRSESDWHALVDYLKAEGKCSQIIAEEDLADAKRLHSFQEHLKERGLSPILGLNAVGGASASFLAKLLGPGGIIVTYGGMSKQPITASTPHFIFKDLRYVGYWHSRWMSQHAYEVKKDMIDSLVNLVLDGVLSCPPVLEVSLPNFQQGLHRNSHQGGTRNKVVFNCQQGLNTTILG
jgi:mitochondrial enoyl-[acyl-carrier protein] reductase / trans-2-enoyl-CoA reductase